MNIAKAYDKLINKWSFKSTAQIDEVVPNDDTIYEENMEGTLTFSLISAYSGFTNDIVRIDRISSASNVDFFINGFDGPFSYIDHLHTYYVSFKYRSSDIFRITNGSAAQSQTDNISSIPVNTDQADVFSDYLTPADITDLWIRTSGGDGSWFEFSDISIHSMTLSTVYGGASFKISNFTESIWEENPVYTVGNLSFEDGNMIITHSGDTAGQVRQKSGQGSFTGKIDDEIYIYKIKIELSNPDILNYIRMACYQSNYGAYYQRTVSDFDGKTYGTFYMDNKKVSADYDRIDLQIYFNGNAVETDWVKFISIEAIKLEEIVQDSISTGILKFENINYINDSFYQKNAIYVKDDTSKIYTNDDGVTLLDDISISLLLKYTNGQTSYKNIWSKGGRASYNSLPYFGFYYYVNRIEFRWNDYTAARIRIQFNQITYDEWQSFFITVNQSTKIIKAYIQGVYYVQYDISSVESVDFTLLPNTGVPVSTEKSKDFHNVSILGMGDIKMWNKVLTDNEIKNLHDTKWK